MLPTVAREIPAYAAQFYVFEGLLRWFRRNENKVNDQMAILISGGLGGVTCWIASYPFDVIKSNIQGDLLGTRWKSTGYLFDGGMVECARHLYRVNGLRGFWIGVLPCLIGVIPGNAALFFSYELTINLLRE
eukprot:TRINITY_DN7046_c0_g3_i6.p1 TRINITY_DN7046_c0_g3~~TRINITY_DN7046_c0_g3_i6.p1  ORF type:complete len:132 (-),score=20.99 TRINITY_DN7046_c0_g3_i6:61-456(-)